MKKLGQLQKTGRFGINKRAFGKTNQRNPPDDTIDAVGVNCAADMKKEGVALP